MCVANLVARLLQIFYNAGLQGKRGTYLADRELDS